MPACLVHGVPNSHHVWDPLRAALGRADVVAPDLPRFAGGPAPDGFDGTKEAYAAWLADQLEAVGEPVDLVGHDWGGDARASGWPSTRPELVRTLAIGSGPIDESYVWHDAAQLWQTPEVGEQVMDGLHARADGAVARRRGVPRRAGREVEASFLDTEMKTAILGLYRSAVDVGREWGPGLEGFDRPALVLAGADDAYVRVDIGERMAAAARRADRGLRGLRPLVAREAGRRGRRRDPAALGRP